MKRKVVLLLITLSIIASMSISCKSAPKEAPPKEPPKTDVALIAKNKADQARKQAMDFDANKYFPSEWDAAEAQYQAATNDTAKYNAVAAVYTDLFNKAVPLYAQAREDELMAVRAEVLATGIADAFPQYIKNADNLALDAKAKYDAGDYYAAKDSADAALSDYQTLLVGGKAYNARQEIVNRGFTKYDPDNFQKSDEIGQKAIDAYEAGDKGTAVTNAEEALLRYNIVLSNGWVAYAANRKEAAEKERQAAIDERANIASKETFRKGDASFDSANEFYNAENYSEAALAYVDAEAGFAISRKETAEKRIRAEEAIKTAEDKIEESSEAAIEAEKIIEGVTK